MPRKLIPLVPGAEELFTPVRLTPYQITEQIARFIISLNAYSPQSQGTYKRCLREFAYYVNSIDLRFRFTPACVERYREYLLHRKARRWGKGRGMSEVAMSQYLTALRRFCQFLVDDGILERNPARSVSGGRRPSHFTRTALTLEQLDRLLVVLSQTDDEEHRRDRAMVLLMLGAGVSEIELHHMDARDIEKVGRNWHIRIRSKGRLLKTDRVILPPLVVDAVESYCALFSGAQQDEPLFKSLSRRSQGKRLSVRSIHFVIEKRFKQAGICIDAGSPRVTPFSLRHTGGIILAESGVSIQHLMDRLRIYWKSTAERYYKLVGTLGSQSRPDLQALVLLSPRRSRRTEQ